MEDYSINLEIVNYGQKKELKYLCPNTKYQSNGNIIFQRDDKQIDKNEYQKLNHIEEFQQPIQYEQNQPELINQHNQQSYIKEFEIKQIPNSYLIKKLTYQFRLNRFHHSFKEYRLLVEDFISSYYQKHITQLQFKEPYNLYYKSSMVKFENNSIIYSQYYSVKYKIFFNIYQFSEQEFIISSKICQKIQNILIQEVFYETIQVDENKKLIFEKSFDLSFKQILENGQICTNFDFSDFTRLLLQLIDIALLLDEYGFYYNQFDIENIGIIYKEGKSIIKLRQIFLLKQDISSYIIKSTSLKGCMNSKNRRKILFYEIISIFDVISLFESKYKSQNKFVDINSLFETQSTKFQKIKSLFADSFEYKSSGIDQNQIFETLEQIFGNDVLNHYPQLNNQYYEMMIKEYNQMYMKNLREKPYENDYVKLYSTVFKELQENSFYQKMCCINQLIIMLVNLQMNQIELFLEQIQNQAHSVDQTLFIQIVSYAIRYLIVYNFNHEFIVSVLELLINWMLIREQYNLLVVLLESISCLYQKDDLSVALDKIDQNQNLNDVKKQVTLLQVLFQILKKNNLKNHQNQLLQNHSERINTLLIEIQNNYKYLNEMDNQRLSSTSIQECEQKSMLFKSFKREFFVPSQEQKQKEAEARKIIELILYIDINPILHSFGLTGKYYSEPYNAEKQFSIDMFKVDKKLLRNYEILYKESINQEDVIDFIQRIRLIRKMTLQKKFIKDLMTNFKVNEINEISKFNIQEKLNTPISQADDNKLLDHISYHIKIAYIKTLEKLYKKNQIQLYLLNMGNDQYYAYYSYDLKDEKQKRSYFLLNVINTQYFYSQLQHLLSINQNNHLNKYLAKIADIDFEHQIIYVVNGLISIPSLIDVYKRSNETFSEKELIMLLYQIFKVIFFLLENKYYIYNFDLYSFALYQASIDKVYIKYYVKYINVVSITNNLIKALSELKFMNNHQFYEQNQNENFTFSEEIYLKISIKQICLNMINLILDQPEQNTNMKQKSSQIILQKNINKIKELYKSEKLSKLFDFLINDLSKLHDKQLILNSIYQKFELETKQQIEDNKDRQVKESNIDNSYQLNSLIYIPIMVKDLSICQMNKLKQCPNFTYYQKIPPFLSFLPKDKLTKLLQNIHDNPYKLKTDKIMLEDYKKNMIYYYHIFLSCFDIISNQIILNNIHLQDYQLSQFIQFKNFLPKLNKEKKLNYHSFYNYKKKKHTQFIKYFLRQGLIDKSSIKIDCQISKDKLFRDKTQYNFISVYSDLFNGEQNKIDESLDLMNLQEEKLENQNKKKKALFLNNCFKNSIESVLVRLQYPSLLQYRKSKQTDKLKKYQKSINWQYYKDKYISVGFDDTLIFINKILIELRINNYEEALKINKSFMKSFSSDDKITSISLTLISQQIKVICMIMLGQDVKEELKNLLDIYISRITFNQSYFINSPQKEFLDLSRNVSEFFLRNNDDYYDLIEQYFKLNLNLNLYEQESASNKEFHQKMEKSNTFQCQLKSFKSIILIWFQKYNIMKYIYQIQFFYKKVKCHQQKELPLYFQNEDQTKEEKQEQEQKILNSTLINDKFLQNNENPIQKISELNVHQQDKDKLEPENSNQVLNIVTSQQIFEIKQQTYIDENLIVIVDNHKLNSENIIKKTSELDVTEQCKYMLQPENSNLELNDNTQQSTLEIKQQKYIDENLIVIVDNHKLNSENIIKKTSELDVTKQYKDMLQPENSNLELNDNNQQSTLEIKQQKYIDENLKATVDNLKLNIEIIKQKTSRLINVTQQDKDKLDLENSNQEVNNMTQKQKLEIKKQSQMEESVTQIITLIQQNSEIIENTQIYQKINLNNTHFDKEKTFDIEEQYNKRANKNMNQQTYKIKINNRCLHYIGNLGKTDSGVVDMYLDDQNMVQYAIKRNHIECKQQYKQEKYNYLTFQEDCNIQGYICKLYGYNDDYLLLIFELGVCNLKQFVKVLSQQPNEPSHKSLSEILDSITQFNILLNQRGIYHGDLKPQNIIITQQEDTYTMRQIFAYEYFPKICIKFIDFQSSSDKPSDYYRYKTKDYKYMGYQNKQDLKMEHILFAEMHSTCMIIYNFLTNGDDKKNVDEKKMNFEQLNQCINDKTQKEGLLLFLSIFLGENDVSKQLKEQGLSRDILNSYRKLIKDKSLEINGDNLYYEELKILSLQLNQIKSKSIKCKKIRAFSYLNKIIEKKINKETEHKIPIEDLKPIIPQLQIITSYFPIKKEVFKCLEDYIKNIEINKESFPYLFQICCFAECHEYKMYQQIFSDSLNKKIKEYKLSFEEQKVISLVIDIFNKELSQNDIINRLEEIQHESKNHEMLYDYYEFILISAFSFDDFKNTSDLTNNSKYLLKQIKFVEDMLYSKKLRKNIFESKMFYQLYIYLYHNSKECQDKTFCKKFFYYRNICKKLDTYIGYDNVYYYNLHTLNLKEDYMKSIDPLSYTFFDNDQTRKLQKTLLATVGDLQYREKEKEKIYYDFQQLQFEKDIEISYNWTLSIQ